MTEPWEFTEALIWATCVGWSHRQSERESERESEGARERAGEQE